MMTFLLAVKVEDDMLGDMYSWLKALCSMPNFFARLHIGLRQICMLWHSSVSVCANKTGEIFITLFSHFPVLQQLWYDTCWAIPHTSDHHAARGPLVQCEELWQQWGYGGFDAASPAEMKLVLDLAGIQPNKDLQCK
eukprot:2533971-Amphidinium_carterae.1